MSLLATQTSSSTPAFEEDDTPKTAPTAAPTNLPATASTTNTAVAVKSSLDHPLQELKNALTVDFNTLDALILSNGNLLLREGKKSVGDSIQIELMSKITESIQPGYKETRKN